MLKKEDEYKRLVTKEKDACLKVKIEIKEMERKFKEVNGQNENKIRELSKNVRNKELSLKNSQSKSASDIKIA